MSNNLIIHRYPTTTDASLQAWNAADQLILNYIYEGQINPLHALIFNDRFGYLTCHLAEHIPLVISNYRSQEKAILQNMSTNHLGKPHFLNALEKNAVPSSLGIIKIPKSMDLFRLQLHQLCDQLTDDGQVICGFMTKYFTPQIVKIAEVYFEQVTQTKAWKKARLMILSGKKAKPEWPILEQINWQEQTLSQYRGVFSSGHIDYATQFFLEHLQIHNEDQTILDLASGNGVIAKFIRDKSPLATIHLVDDSWLAVASSKLNLKEDNHHFHYNDTLDDIEDGSLDLIVSNPPFHFDFETNTEITFSLFSQAKQKLKPGSRFELVANRHLPYKPFLEKLFKHVMIVTQNNNFIIYSCLNR